jgi:methylated-DNA-[protein]-cysteine S-methyltransferase
MKSKLRSAQLMTPLGPFAIIASDLGVHAAGFTTSVELDDWLQIRARDGSDTLGSAPRPVEDLGEIANSVRSYFDGDLRALDGLPVTQAGGPFVSAAWEAMRSIPCGSTITYRELAASAGRSAAVRAAGMACAGNRVALIVPCHRVVRSDGGLGGYRWGLAVKRWLLAHETANSASQ